MEKFWCLHCGRVFEGCEFQMGCGYADCDGHLGDFIEWKEFRKLLSEQSPECPVIGEVYRMYR